MIDNNNNEIRGGRVKRNAGGDEKQLKFASPYARMQPVVTNFTSTALIIMMAINTSGS